MRVIPILLVFASITANAQVWEKSIAPGVVYRMEVDTQATRVIHAIRFAREAGSVQATPQLAQGSVFGKDDDKKGREVLSSTVERYGALAGVNGDFFPWTGDPLGTMVRDGELVSKPFPGRSVFGWGPGYSKVARLKWTGSASFLGKESLKIDGLNEVCSKDFLMLNTHDAGYAVSDAKSLHVVIESPAELTPNGTWKGKVITTVSDETRVPVGKGQVVLTATGKSIEKLQFLGKGEEVTFKLTTEGLDWSKAKNVIGGGPVIVTDGKPIQAWDAEDFNAEFATKRHPRSAIGCTALGDIWIVEIEGRQALSAGATIDELAALMARLGCVEALNLDGGGSSEVALSGMVVNRPSDGAERPIANAVLIFGKPASPAEAREYVIQGKPRISAGTATDLKVVDSKGHEVMQSEVVWSASGDGWIDQSGRLRTLQPGHANVKAWIKGTVVSLTITIEAPTPKSGAR